MEVSTRALEQNQQMLWWGKDVQSSVSPIDFFPCRAEPDSGFPRVLCGPSVQKAGYVVHAVDDPRGV